MWSELQCHDSRALRSGGGFAKLTPTLFQMTGADVRQFLHNFCTADVKKLAPGHAVEAFVLNEKGKTIGHIHVVSLRDSIELLTVAGQFKTLFDHWDRYNFREDVLIEDNSDQRDTYFLAESANLTEFGVDVAGLQRNQVVQFDIGGHVGWAAKLELADWGVVLVAPTEAELDKRLEELNLRPCDPMVFDAWRVERGVPTFGADITDDNLPQEIQRDEKAISFDKGCYLGQETVARIDALGQVNRLLVSVSIDGPATPGDSLEVDGKVIGRLTSVAWSPDHSRWVGMALVRRSFLDSEWQCRDFKVSVQVS